MTAINDPFRSTDFDTFRDAVVNDPLRAAAVQDVLHDYLDGMIEWHPQYGEDSHEQWEIDTEAAFVRAIKADGDLIDRLVAAALGNGSEVPR